MADDIKIKLGLDATELFNGISKATGDLNKLAVTADKTETELKQLDDQKIDIDIAPAEQGLNSLASKAKDLGSEIKSSFNMQNLASGLAGGIAGGLATGGISTVISGIQSIGSNIFNAAMEADEFGDTLEVAFKQQGIEDVDAEIEKVSASTRKLADDLGLPTQRTRELATTVATMGGISGKQAEELTKLSAGLETFSGGAVKGEAVALAFSKGLADPEGAAAIEKLAKKYPQLAETLRSNIEPAEKMRIANELLGESFKTVAEQQGDAGGTFNKLSNALSAAYETIGTGIMDVINMVIPIFTESLGPSIKELMDNIGGYFERVWSIAQPIWMAIGGLIMLTISNIINVITEFVNVIFENLIYAFDSVVNAIDPLIDAIKSALGLDGAMGEGIDVVEMLQEAMNFMGDAISAVFDVLQSLAKIFIDIVVVAFKAVIDVIILFIEKFVSISKAIGNFISGIPGVQTAINALKGAFDNVYNFFAGLPGIIAESQAYLKAIGGTFQTVFGIIGEAFKAALNLDFDGATAKLASVFQSQTWVNAFSSNLAKARAELKSTTDAAKNSATAVESFATATSKTGGGGGSKGGGKGGGGKGGAAGIPDPSEYKQAVEAYQDYLKELDIKRREALQSDAYKDLTQEEVQLKLQAEGLAPTAEAMKAEILKRFGATKDAQGNLVLGVKLGKDEDREDALRNVRQLLLDAGKFEAKIKVKPTDFKETIKEFETLAKDIEKTSENLLPKTLAGNQESLDATIASVQQYIDFIKIQNDEIAVKQAEAIAAGNQEAADKFGESIQSNVKNINLLSSRLERFGTDSKAAIEKTALESTLQFQIQTALQTSILDAFNSEKIRKEKEANDAIRAERLGALQTEEDDLMGSLAKREISFEEYSAKIAEIDAQRKQVEEQTEVTFLQRLKTAGDQAAASVLKSQAAIFKKNAEGMEGNQKIFNEFVGQTLEQFGTLAASGKATLADFGNAAAGAAFDAVSKMIPSFVVGILGSSITTLGPIAGPIIAATLTAGLQLLLAAARGSLGFKDGVVGLEGPGTERSDSIPAWLSKGESVITAAGTRANREELEWMNKNPGMSIRDYFTANTPAVRYSVNNDGDLIQEVRKLREETRGLGKQINRNTHVEISGALVADNNSIKAVIERDRRRNARRG